MRNRTQIFLLILGTLALTAAIVAGIVFYSFRPKELAIAVGPVGTPEQMFAVRLQTLLVQNNAKVRINVQTRQTNAMAVADLGKNGVDLVVLRTDAKIPAAARALALLDKDVLLIVEPKGSKSKTIADLRGKKIAVLGDDAANEELIRSVLDLYNMSGPGLRLTRLPVSTPVDKLLAPGGYNAVMIVETRSVLDGTRTYEALARSTGFGLGALEEAKAIAGKIAGLDTETVEAGVVSSAPRIPDEDADTLSLEHLLVGRDKLAEALVVQLARNIFENKSALGVPGVFATHIEPPDTDKDAFIAAHNGVTQYVENDEKTFLDRYSDWIYLSLYVGGIVGSLGLTLFASVTRNKPKHAHEFAGDYLAQADRIRAAGSEEELRAIETEMRENLRDAVTGMKTGKVSPRGVDALRLCYEHAREAAAERRAALRAAPPPSLLVSNPESKRIGVGLP